MNATRAAVEEGIVPGGGLALLKAASALDKVKTSNSDQKAGVDIVRRALEAPIRTISNNAGVDGPVIVGKLKEEKSATIGYDAQNDKFVDMFKAGIIDPTKVVRTSLQNAETLAGIVRTLLLSTESRWKTKVTATSAIFPWLLQHAVWLYNRF